MRVVKCIDLTTLSGDDTASNIMRLCYKARYPIREDIMEALKMADKGRVLKQCCAVVQWKVKPCTCKCSRGHSDRPRVKLLDGK